MANTNRRKPPTPPPTSDLVVIDGPSGVELPPKTGAPSPPAGFKVPKKGENPRYPYNATEQQIRDLNDVANELDTPNYAEDFGRRAPDQKKLVNLLRATKDWYNELAAAETWVAYVRSRTMPIASMTIGEMEKLKDDFELALEDDAGLLKRYRQTNDFLSVRKKAADKGAKTRAKKKKAATKKDKTP